jgi:hypothetical protein
MKTKICYTCKIEKEFDKFGKGYHFIRDGKNTFWLTNRCKECANKKRREHYYAHLEQERARCRKSAKIYRLKMIKKNNKSINLRLKNILRTKIYASLKGHYKSHTLFKLLGCNINQLIAHLEFQFKEGMNWTNYGNGWHGRGMKEWHIDHIIPCASFNLTNNEELEKCFHYTNLQPLWAQENWSKSDKYEKILLDKTEK